MVETEPKQIEAVRRFGRFYTGQIGVLREGLLDSPFSLTEARIIYELAHHEQATASVLGDELALDPGYISRLLRRLQKAGLLKKKASGEDMRVKLLFLTKKGQEAFAKLNAASRSQVEAMLADLSDVDRQRLIGAMSTIQRILGAEREQRVPYILRTHQPGDMGWVLQRHGLLYSLEYDWDEKFEALVAGIVTKFIQNFDPRKERCWIAEKDGENVGSVFLVRKSGRVAQLRLLLVEPHARGLGIGKRLVSECTRFARQVGYRKITLWTNGVLHAARSIYEREGYRLVEEEPHHSFGHDLVGQSFELEL
jgi:DNA-binding MarR family transcriptional regulator/ribosomal protein S18 acetylase RimI-like enzyme